MSAQVIEFRNPTQPIAQFIRIDEAHRRLGDLYAAGHLSIRRAVFDASRIQSQKEFVDALRRNSVEIVLDTEVAELAAREKFLTHVKKAPWAAVADGQPLHASFFDGTYSQVNIIDWIVRFAIENRVNTVLAPTHFLADRDCGNWMEIDTNSCVELRLALDRHGGNDIAIDYPVIHAHTSINQLEMRNALLERIRDLPIDNVWLRASGLGSEPKPQTAKQFLASLYDLQRVNRPIIVDHVDGLMAQALLAFGGASGVAHGIGERISFKANNWHKAPEARDEDKPFGRTVYIAIPGLGRRLTVKELELLSSAKNGKKFLGCQDSCCAHGLRDTLSDPRQHAAYQSVAPIKALADVPDLNREAYFLEHPLLDAERLARNIKDLNPSTVEAERLKVDLTSLKSRLTEHHRKIGKFSDALSTLHDDRKSGSPRAQVCHYRVKPDIERKKEL